jgi:DNA recombination-dependent growth factor C
MAPRKKTEEKASANEAADMVLHYLRKSLTSLRILPLESALQASIALFLTTYRQAEPSVLGD